MLFERTTRKKGMTLAVTPSIGSRIGFTDATNLQAGDSVHFRATITEKDVQAFADVSGDYNPLHMDSAFARRTNFQRRVVHGMILASYVSRLVGMQLPGPGALWTQQSFRWPAPVFIDDTVEIALTVKHKSNASNLLTLVVKATKQDGTTVMEGEGTAIVVETRLEHKDLAISQRVALVTGGSRGIGAAIALELGRAGAAVAVLYRRHGDEAQSVCAELTAFGGRAIAVEADVLDPAAVAAAGTRVREAFGRPVDVLVNSAGGPVEPRAFLELTWLDLQAHLDLHVRGAFHCSQAVIPGMLEQGSGRIVNIGSALTWNVPPLFWTGFVMSKAALKSMTRSLATEFGPKGIRVNMVSPGLSETDSLAELPERMRKLQAIQAPLRRLSSPCDVARAVAFLCSEGGAAITGADIPVCAGANM
jgi:3-oxoacyl-[acyl-carrier protein] reductase